MHERHRTTKLVRLSAAGLGFTGDWRGDQRTFPAP